MSFMIIIGIFAALLFFSMYFTHRRFGVVGLALAAGAMLSTLWTDTATPAVAQAGIELVRPPLEVVVAAALTLMPALVLLFGGPTYKIKIQRLLGSAAFALLAIVLLLEPLGTGLVIDSTGRPVYELLKQYQHLIVTAGLVAAVADLLMTRTPKHSKQQAH
jgi:hypothetical protein